MKNKVNIIIVTFILLIMCKCKSDPNFSLPKKLYRSLELTDFQDFSNYKHSKKFDLIEYWTSVGSSKNYFTLSKFSSKHNDYSAYFLNSTFRIKALNDKKFMEFIYYYVDGESITGILDEVRCLEFTQSYKDCMLNILLDFQSPGESKRQLIIRSNDNILFYVYVIGGDIEAFFLCRSNDVQTESEVRKRIGTCLKILRDTPGHPPLESLVYDKESVDYFLEAVKE